MKKIKQIIKIIKKPKFLLLVIDNIGLYHLHDKKYLELRYEFLMNKKLNLNNPKTFNEKLQWLKLNDRKDCYTNMVDKYEAKEYVSKIIGSHIIPTLGVYDKFDDINFDKLPNQFVIKCTHDSASLVIVKDKSKFDIQSAKVKINKCLRNNYYYLGREWPYKNVKPRIIVEKYMEDSTSKDLKDYKFFCFDGRPEVLYISTGSHTDNQQIAFFDMNYNLLNIKRTDYNDYDTLPNKPKEFEKMKKFASMLSKNIPHLRVDFYEVDGNVYFGELTFYTGSGYIPFTNEKYDRKLGDYIKINI